MSLRGIRVEVRIGVITLHAFVVGVVLHASWDEVELSVRHIIRQLGLAHANGGQFLVLVRDGTTGAVVANRCVNVIVRCVGEVKVELTEVIGLTVGFEENERLNTIALKEDIP